MKFNRRSIRLPKYDYSQPGAYFITICTYQRKWLFGEILHEKMLLNKFGNTARNEWLKTPKIRPNIELGEFIIMPNHIHGIIWIKEVEVNGKGVWDSEGESKGISQYAPTIPATATVSNGTVHRPQRSITYQRLKNLANQLQILFQRLFVLSKQQQQSK